MSSFTFPQTLTSFVTKYVSFSANGFEVREEKFGSADMADVNMMDADAEMETNWKHKSFQTGVI